MTYSLVGYGILGIISTAIAFAGNRRLFVPGGAARTSFLECLYYALGLVSLGLGWYFNVRYVHDYGHTASYVDYTKALFSNWASDSAAQDYIMVNVVLLPLWTIVGRSQAGIAHPLDLLRDEPLHQPGLLHGLLPGIRRAPDPLQPGARRSSTA